ncbi:methylmalonyl-CoA mutase family protein [Brevundimonas sp.]|uniref:methylmalonyl-CoA mutase family protein n=1 Tax=Brevundimonas sp. TaxID=1871086 RepID=UPI003BAD3108
MTFETPTPEQWRDSAIKALKDRPLESLLHLDADHLAIRPLYADATGITPLFTPRTTDAEGRSWDLRTQVEGDDALAVNAAVLTDLEGGAASVIVSGGVLADADVLGRALENVALELAAVGLDAGLDGPSAADALAVVAKGSPRAKLMFHLDPISAHAANGGSPRPLQDHVTEAAQTAARHANTYPEATFFLASGRAVHEAGGSAGQELGVIAASIVAYVRAAIDAGLSAEQALKGTVLSLSVDAEYFDSLAKTRALRLIWASVTKAFDLDIAANIETRSSRRMLASRDPWPNLLRLTAAGFAGAVGGADAVVLDGFTRASGRPDAFARRQARNTQIVLMEEAHLGRVDDPAAGSWFLDSRTQDMAQAGWAEFQRIEREGGIVASLKGGAVQMRVAAARQTLQNAYDKGASQIIGVTKFVDPDVRPAPIEPSAARASAAITDSCAPLLPIRFAAAFEKAD